jgi:hypothetical protein
VKKCVHKDGTGRTCLRLTHKQVPVPCASRACLRWLALAGVVGLVVFAVTRERPTKAPDKPDLAGTADRSWPKPASDATQSDTEGVTLQDVARTTTGGRDRFLARSVDGLPMAVHPAPDAGAGEEMPFVVSGDQGNVANAGLALPSDPAGLCSALHDALAAGAGAKASAIRNRLLALDGHAVPALSEWLHCGVVSVEVEAVRLLAGIGDAQGLAAALGKLLTTPVNEPSYRHFRAAFADNRSPAVAAWLVRMLGEVEQEQTGERLLDLLYAMRGPETVEALAWAALNPLDDTHAGDTLDSLAMRRDPSETDALVAALSAETESVRIAAAFGLAGVGSGMACSILAGEAESAPMGSAGQALGTVSSSYAQETLLALALDAGRSAEVRIAAVHSLSGQSGYRVQTVLDNAVMQERDTAVAVAMQMALETVNQNQAEAGEYSPVTGSDRGELCF